MKEEKCVITRECVGMGKHLRVTKLDALTVKGKKGERIDPVVDPVREKIQITRMILQRRKERKINQ